MKKNGNKFKKQKGLGNHHQCIYLLIYLVILVFPLLLSSFDYFWASCSFLIGVILFFISLFSMLKCVHAPRWLTGCVLMFPSIFYVLDLMPVSTSSMGLSCNDIMAICQSNVPEAIAYVKDHLNIYCFVLLFLFFVFFVYLSILQNKEKSGFIKNRLINWICMGVGLVLLGWNSLNALTMPFYEAFEKFQQYRDFYNNLKNRPVPENIQKNTLNGIYVIVIGESQNRDHMSVYGYKNHDTTPFLSEMAKDTRWFFFKNAYSCHVHTIATLTYALTQKNNHNTIDLEDAYSISDVLHDFNTYWISNQKPVGYYGEPITEIGLKTKSSVFINKSFVDKDPYDDELLPLLPKEQDLQDTSVIFVHLMGNHGTYSDRYREEYNKWSSSYDNSVLYTDSVIQKIYTHFSSMKNFMSLIYFSDHAEDLECKCHNPSKFTWDMTKIPFYVYLSDKYIQQYPDKVRALKKHKNVAFSNDMIFDTILGVLDITDKRFYVPENDFSSTKYNHSLKDLTTIHGEKRLSEQFQTSQGVKE